MRGKELDGAEKLFIANLSKEPFPTELQNKYIAESRVSENIQLEEKRKTRARLRNLALILVGAVIFAMMVTILATVFGGQVGISSIRVGLANATAQAGATLAEEQANANVTAQIEAEQQSNARATAQVEAEQQSIGRATAQIEAEQQSNARATAQADAKAQQTLANQQAQIARARELAALSVNQRDKTFDLSMLLGIEAFRKDDTTQTRSALLDNSQSNPQLLQYLYGQTNSVSSVAFSPNGTMLASGNANNTITLWNVVTGLPIGQPFKGHTSPVIKHSL